MGDPKDLRATAEAARFTVGDEEFAVIAIAKEPPKCLESLTRTEREVAALILEGKTNAEIAKVRRVSVNTVHNQVATLLRKLGVGARSELAALVGRGG